MTEPKTKYVGRNPFKPKAPSKIVQVEGLEITNDPLPEKRIAAHKKYDELFASLKVGNALKCKPEEVTALARALRNWVEIQGKKDVLSVKQVMHYHTDKMGRVWLLNKE